MSEYELLNLMYMAFTQNAIYFVGMIFLTFILLVSDYET